MSARSRSPWETTWSTSIRWRTSREWPATGWSSSRPATPCPRTTPAMPRSRRPGRRGCSWPRVPTARATRSSPHSARRASPPSRSRPQTSRVWSGSRRTRRSCSSTPMPECLRPLRCRRSARPPGTSAAGSSSSGASGPTRSAGIAEPTSKRCCRSSPRYAIRCGRSRSPRCWPSTPAVRCPRATAPVGTASRVVATGPRAGSTRPTSPAAPRPAASPRSRPATRSACWPSTPSTGGSSTCRSSPPRTSSARVWRVWSRRGTPISPRRCSTRARSCARPRRR